MDSMNILICTDGSKASEVAAKQVILFQFPPDTRAVLFHVVEKKTEQKALEPIISPCERVLSYYFQTVERKVVLGNATARILAESREQHYDLIALGVTGTGWGLKRQRIGSNASKIARQVETPLLLARPYSDVLKKVLVCTGGESPSSEMMHKAGFLVSLSKAQVGVLHVMSQLALSTSRQTDDLLDTAKTAMERRTWEGLHLTWAVDQIRQSGVTAPIDPIIRHGLVVDQIMAELREGKYDLLVIGSHHVSGRSRTLEVFLEDVARDLVCAAPCSVLII